MTQEESKLMPEIKSLESFKTFRISVAEFHARGEWDLYNVFAVGGAWMVMNGTLMPNTDAGGWISGVMTGQPIFHCGLCGTDISEHYTVKNNAGEEINVGSSCIHNVMHQDKADAILKGIKSLQRKVETDFKREIYFPQLVQWLNENVKELDRLHNIIIDIRLKSNPEFYWSSPTKLVYQFDENSKPVMEFKDDKYIQVCREVAVPENERKKDAGYLERRDRNYWNYTNENFVKRGWNPNTMAKSFRDSIKNYEQPVDVPKIRKITDEERQAMFKRRQDLTDQFVKRLNSLNSRGKKQ